MSAVEGVVNTHRDMNLRFNEALESAEDANLVEAISDRSINTFVLQASMQTFMSMQNMSLFNLMR